MEKLRELLEEIEFRFLWLVLPFHARQLALRALRLQACQQRALGRRWCYQRAHPIIIGQVITFTFSRPLIAALS